MKTVPFLSILSWDSLTLCFSNQYCRVIINKHWDVGLNPDFTTVPGFDFDDYNVLWGSLDRIDALTDG